MCPSSHVSAVKCIHLYHSVYMYMQYAPTTACVPYHLAWCDPLPVLKVHCLPTQLGTCTAPPYLSVSPQLSSRPPPLYMPIHQTSSIAKASPTELVRSLSVSRSQVSLPSTLPCQERISEACLDRFVVSIVFCFLPCLKKEPSAY